MTPRPIYLTDGPEPVLAMLHDAAAPRDVAVLMLPPFGWEEMCSARARLNWANDLSGRGYAAMRIDLPGTGDSGGSPWTLGLFDLWIESVGAAARRERDQFERQLHVIALHRHGHAEHVEPDQLRIHESVRPDVRRRLLRSGSQARRRRRKTAR